MSHLDLRFQTLHPGTEKGFGYLTVHDPKSRSWIRIKEGDLPLQADVEVEQPKEAYETPLQRRWLYGTVGEPRPDFMRAEMIGIVIKLKVPSNQIDGGMETETPLAQMTVGELQVRAMNFEKEIAALCKRIEELKYPLSGPNIAELSWNLEMAQLKLRLLHETDLALKTAHSQALGD